MIKLINMISKENNFAFIDSQNLNLGIRAQGWELDFARFRVYLKDKHYISKAFLFIGYVKGNVDAELVLHAMIHINDFDQALIVTGDGDFHCLVEYLLEQKKLLALMVPNRKKYSGLLKRKYFLPYTRFVADIRNKVQKKRKTPMRTKPHQGTLSVRDNSSISPPKIMSIALSTSKQ
ncbi:hypothetical protein A3I36_00335 [Candidatus Giovannonibacteria bacterium RIFCSPLOWO2_02_FULL_45_28]|uniref:NYN domain-containing protein n=1 Tax=Candidatus Giovannonibacteria bacterium RIFCSPHIGHO2_02_FULL_45_40 TaxID=1798337 RepID=A0A1F5WAP7_9BACT|nr:MAG: hypothetical protein A2W40_00690 [Candidatus Giovannonibacteria bacterium RIFCSPHIGHO2_01_45_12]OGF60228.1 MAG: hypothetical protein A2656_03695 [Candidatus Giovannonibacteria bacterium RIFCSPHIGHO2_01_FULL_44_100]OGF72735.1 MAG: hypothetical protein A3C05_03125 [Candidatus Giovannonibacteria bacterium RIFCSPHIGHO2_02_FULL_45_40]OGF83516.1 MAG: hypothetical protein A3E63_05020 [Candidatus Giovannonibacteria bacterium RIFCSPHIGHO2_12_FULL_45_19]OGF84782.1 MAG: hypothetical protein A3A19_